MRGVAGRGAWGRAEEGTRGVVPREQEERDCDLRAREGDAGKLISGVFAEDERPAAALPSSEPSQRKRASGGRRAPSASRSSTFRGCSRPPPAEPGRGGLDEKLRCGARGSGRRRAGAGPQTLWASPPAALAHSRNAAGRRERGSFSAGEQAAEREGAREGKAGQRAHRTW